MTTLPKPTAFWGPQKAYMRDVDWPWPFQMHLQLHDMQPGDLWNATDAALLQTKRILPATGSPGNFRLSAPPWFYQYRHRKELLWIRVRYFTVIHTTFTIQIVHLRQQFAFNEILKPDGVFAFGGFATLAWEAL